MDTTVLGHDPSHHDPLVAVLHLRDASGRSWVEPHRLDGQAGLLLALDHAVVGLRVDAPRLRFLDIVRAAGLQVLDVSQVDTAPHITVADCPLLREVAVPEGDAQGAVLHVASGLGEPSLQVRGAVDHLDLAWYAPTSSGDWPEAGTRPLTATLGGKDRPLGASQGIFVGALRGTWWQNGMVIGLRGDDTATLVVPADAACRTLVVQGVTELQRVAVHAPLNVLTLRDCPRVREVDVNWPCKRLRIEGCAAIEQIDGDGHSLTMTAGSCTGNLAVSGRWRTLRVVSSPLQTLNAPLLALVEITLCPELTRVTILAGARLAMAAIPRLDSIEGPSRIRLDPNGAFDALRARVQYDPHLRDALLADIVESRGVEGHLRALMILAELARAGVDHHKLWRARAGLRAPCQYRGWQWQFPGDLGDRGWMADLRLWLSCRETVPAAAAIRAELEQAHEPHHIAATARTFAGVGDNHPDADKLRFDLASLLLAQLRWGADYGKSLAAGRPDRMIADGLEPHVEARVQAVVRMVLSPPRHALTLPLAEALTAWLGRCLPCVEGLQMLAMLHGRGTVAATTMLQQVAGGRDAAGLYRVAMALLLSTTVQPEWEVS